MKKYWSNKARELTPYTAGEQPTEQLVKLNTNENAYPPSPKVQAAVQAATKRLELYPDPDSRELRAAIAKVEGVSIEQVFCANGSDEALALAYMAFFNPVEQVNTPDVTYSFYPVWAQLFDISLHQVPLLSDFSVDVAAMPCKGGVLLANPNAPTSMVLDLASIESIVQDSKGVVVVDEAYIAFGGETAVSLIDRYKNLAVVRTFSKSHSLAGLRVGYVLADESLIEALHAVKDSFNSYPLDRLAQAGARAAMQDTAYYEFATENIIRDRETTRKTLKEMGLTVLPSAANFLFVKVEDAADVFAQLRQRGILVRYFPGGRTNNYLRVTVGTTQQMAEFLQAMQAILVDG